MCLSWLCLALLPAVVRAETGKTPLLGAADFYPSPERPVGWRGDNTACYPGATPVIKWGYPAGTRDFSDRNCRNMVWRTMMPNWSNSSPIVIGDKVITLAEPYTVVCVHAKTGKILWTSSNDHLDLLCSPQEARALRDKQEMHMWAWWGSNHLLPSLRRRYQKAMETGDRILPDKSGIPPTIIRWHYEDLHRGAYDVKFSIEFWEKKVAAWEERYPDEKIARFQRSLTPWGLYPADVWHWIGHTMMTPCSDGRFVYAAFGSNTAACYDLETGKCKWMRFFGIHPSRLFDQPKLGRGTGYGCDGWRDCNLVPSPQLFNGIFVLQTGNVIRGLSAETGDTLWSLLYPGSGSGTFASMRVDGVDLIVTTLGWVVRVSDGKLLATDVGRGLNMGGDSRFADKDIVFALDGGTGGAPSTRRSYAYRLAFDGPDKIASKLLWAVNAVSSEATSLHHDGYVYLHSGPRMIDVATGTLVPGRNTGFRSGGGSTCNAVAGQYVFHGGGIAVVTEVGPEGRVVGGGNLMLGPQFGSMGNDYAPAPRDFLDTWDKHRWQCKKDGILSYVDPDPRPSLSLLEGNHFFHGDYFYIRSRTHLYCIGPRVKGAPSDDPEMIAAIRNAKDDSVPVLIERLKSDSPCYRYEAVKSLARLEAKAAAAAPALKETIGSDWYVEVREEAARALNRMDAEGKAGIVALVARRDTDALARIGDAGIVALIGLLDDPKERHTTASVLARMDKQAIPHLLATLKDPTLPISRRTGVTETLGEIGSRARESIPLLISAMSEDDPGLRSASAKALGAMGSWAKHAVPSLAAGLTDKAVEVRASSAAALGALRSVGQDAVPALLKAMEDKDAGVRATSALALAEMEGVAGESTPVLVKALADTEKQVRRASATALGKLGLRADSAVPALVKVLEDADLDVRYLAFAALGNMAPSSQTAVPAIAQGLTSKDARTKASAAATIAKLGKDAQSTVPMLIELLKDTSTEVRRNACSALASMGSAAAPAIPALREAQRDEDELVRSFALEALAAIQSEQERLINH